jgi:hypothetical protein
MPPDTTEILEGSEPFQAIEGTTSFGKPGYGGPCPPRGTGTHHYIFEVYALDKSLELLSSATREDLLIEMKGHVLAQAILVGLFKADE